MGTRTTTTVVQMRSSVDSEPAVGTSAVQDLMAEVRNVRYAGQPGADSDQIRLARLELKLKTMRVRLCFDLVALSCLRWC